MSFLKLCNADISFGKKTLTWKSHTINKALPTNEQVQIINPKKFVIAALDADNKTFVRHVAIREQEKMPMYIEKQAQIKMKAQVEALIFDKALKSVPAKYFNYSNVFSVENAMELLENTGINEHTIELKEGKQPLFGHI